LGFFLSGSASLGDRPTEPEHSGFDLDTQGLTGGVDYWFDDRLALGLAAGYRDDGSRFSRGRGSMEVSGWNVAAYGTYSVDSFYAEGAASWGSSRYRLLRRVDLAAPVGGQQTFALRAEPDGTQLAATLGIGYEVNRSAVTLDTFGRIHWLEARVDAFAENGGGPFAFTLERQQARSLLGEAGFDLSHAASLRWGVLLSQLRLAAVRELEDDPRPIRGHLTAQPAGGQFTLAAAARDRDYFHAAAGLAATLPRGRSLFVNYERDLSRRGLSVSTFSAGLRLAF
jgi:outer membrane autotransporter protein